MGACMTTSQLGGRIAEFPNIGCSRIGFELPVDQFRPVAWLRVSPFFAANVTSLKQNHFICASIVLNTWDDDLLHEPGMRRYRALFISDLHLGTKACQAEAFIDFLRCHDAARIYLIGDIVDFWRIKRGIYWPQAHNDVLQKLCARCARAPTSSSFPAITTRPCAIIADRASAASLSSAISCMSAPTEGAISIIHGDEFDVVVRYAKWLALFGDWSYMVALWANTHFNAVRRWLGMPYWSLSAYLKQRVKRAVNYIGEFETALAQEARRHGAQGVICGHIHHAAMRQLGDVIYINTGDWVESCTAVAESEEGIFEIIRWTHPSQAMQSAATSSRGARGCRLMRVLVATDAWHPQVNGVVRTYERLVLEAPKLGCDIAFLSPALFRTLPCPTYPEIRLAFASPRAIARHVERMRPDFIHIATEGPIGLMTRRYCRKRKWPFTTSYHTRFPEYVSARLPVPERWCYALQRRFHNGAAGTFVATPSVAADLAARGFERLMPWSRGVDTELFRPRDMRLFGDAPVFLYVGRIAVEKNIKAFLELDLPGRKVLVGSGPQMAELRRSYPDVLFAGPLRGRGAGGSLCLGGCVRVPEPHRYVRPGCARSAGLRRSGSRLSGERTKGRGDRPPRRRSERRLEGRGVARACPRQGSGKGACPDL